MVSLLGSNTVGAYVRSAQLAHQDAVFRAPLSGGTLAKARNVDAAQHPYAGRTHTRYSHLQVLACHLDTGARSKCQ